MNQARLLEHAKTVKELLGEDAHQLQTQSLELVLLDKLVKIGRQAFEHET